MAQFKLRVCKKSGQEWKQYNSLQKCPCNECKSEKQPTNRQGGKNRFKKAKIKPISDKRKKEQALYQLERILFLREPENQNCAIKGTYCTGKATSIEHSAGRKGYYDEWSRENNISLYLDKRFWKAACNNCNLELENNPELSKQHQLSKIHGGKKI
jgi:hypothetical protein